MALTGVLGDRQIGDQHVVEVAPTQVVDVVADLRELEAEESLPGAEVAKMKQKMDLGTDRATLLEDLALRCRQREEQVPVALGEAWKAPQQLVLFRREDLQAIAALGEAITVKIVER